MAQNKRQYPVEILRDIASLITNRADLSDFARCGTTTWAVGEEKLWKMDTGRPLKPALYWAIENNNLALAKKALDKYEELHATGLIVGNGIHWGTFMWRDGTPARTRPAAPFMLAVESGSMDMLSLVVFRAIAAGQSHDMRCQLGQYGPWGWHIHGNHGCGCGGHCRRCIEACRGRCFARFENGTDTSRIDRYWAKGPTSCEAAMHLAIWERRPDMLRFMLEYGIKVGCPEWSDDKSWALFFSMMRLLMSVRDIAEGKPAPSSSEVEQHRQMAKMIMEVVTNRYGVSVADAGVIDLSFLKLNRFSDLLRSLWR